MDSLGSARINNGNVLADKDFEKLNGCRAVGAEKQSMQNKRVSSIVMFTLHYISTRKQCPLTISDERTLVL